MTSAVMTAAATIQSEKGAGAKSTTMTRRKGEVYLGVSELRAELDYDCKYKN